MVPIDDAGIRHVTASDEAGLYRGMGECHALDRSMQMILMRILGRGEASLHLDGSDAMLEVDLFFRRMNWRPTPATGLDGVPLRNCEAYCEGVNRVLQERIPWEIRLLGIEPDPWTLDDILLLARMAGYLTLAQSQTEMERLIVEWVQAGIPRDRLEALFPGLLGGLDEDLVRKVTLRERIVPETLRWGGAAPRMMASNNWVVSGRKTASGSPILANDPHLEANRLPAVWYELVFEAPDRTAIGATMPGLPAMIIARTPSLSWGVTYSFMDAVDSWIEQCRDGKRLGPDGKWHAFQERKETIRRKKGAPVERVFHECEHGVLDGDPHVEGHYLATRWSAAGSGPASIEAFHDLLRASTVTEGMAHVGRIETAWNWVLADTDGNIGYQMSGLLPKRREGASGLVPLPGWESRNDWSGFTDPEDLPRAYNPAEGYFVTANQDMNAHGRARPNTLPMGPYRADRIGHLLQTGSSLTLEDMFRIQHDLVSPQADAFMKILRPLLPDTPQGRTLAEWDLSYDVESRGAFLFERVYRGLLREVFGRGGMGEEVFDHLVKESGIFVDFYLPFDRVLLSENSPWFGGNERDAIYRRVATAELDVEPRPWGESQQIMMSHLIFGGKLPRWTGFDRGPVTLKGGRATPHQGQVYRSGGRTTSFAPSFRFVTDLATDEVHSCLCGGPSDRRFSKRYSSELENWVKGAYKRLKPGSA